MGKPKCEKIEVFVQKIALLKNPFIRISICFYKEKQDSKTLAYQLQQEDRTLFGILGGFLNERYN
jgi:hypothetical protein